jgi:hypothetical protein
MKTTILILGLAALTTACGSQPDDSTTTRASEAVVAIEGENPVAIHSALLALADVQVVADGQTLTTAIDDAVADLAKPGDRITLRVPVPNDALVLDVRLRLDDFGGYEADDQAGEIDARGTVFRFQLPARRLADSGNAAIRIDLGRALAGVRPERLVLLPIFAVDY